MASWFPYSFLFWHDRIGEKVLPELTGVPLTAGRRAGGHTQILLGRGGDGHCGGDSTDG